MIGEKVIIEFPERLKGLHAEIRGDRFKYPGQSFWVYPVILLPSGKEELIVSYTSIIDESVEKAAAEIEEFFKETIVKIDPRTVYDYQDLLETAKCPSCGHNLKWILSNDPVNGHNMSDKFCFAECCGMQYGMVPEKVRIISVPVASIRSKEFIEKLAQQEADHDFYSTLDGYK